MFLASYRLIVFALMTLVAYCVLLPIVFPSDGALSLYCLISDEYGSVTPHSHTLIKHPKATVVFISSGS